MKWMRLALVFFSTFSALMIPVHAANGTKKDDMKEFDGSLKENSSYTATWPIGAVRVPFHHAFRIEWTNIEKFPNLSSGDRVTFKVEKVETVKIDEQRWNDTFSCTLVSVASKSNKK